MAFDVHLSVVFACDRNDAIAEVARKHLAGLSDTDPREVIWFLASVAERRGPNYGAKGGVLTWGAVGNHTDPEIFVRTLVPFFTEVLRGVDGGPLDFEHVLIFYEREQSEHASAFELSLSKPAAAADATLVVEHHPELPFAWMQF